MAAGEEKQAGEERTGNLAVVPLQKRGQEREGADKFRITVECRQVLLGYFDEEVEPEAVVGPSAVIFPGVHCRLSISQRTTGGRRLRCSTSTARR